MSIANDRMVKWGVLGTASIAKGCTIPGMKKANNCELVAIAGRDINKAEAFKEEFGFQKAYGNYEDLLNDPDVEVVYIPLPNSMHVEWCLKAIKAGKHVLCEKPLAPSAEEAEKLFKAAEEAGVILMEAFAYLHTDYVQQLKKAVFEEKQIGDIRYLESAFIIQTSEDDNIRMRRETYGGSVYDVGCYCVSLMTWLMGEKPEEVKGLAEYTDKKIDIYSSVYMKYKNGVRASFNCGMIFGKEHDSRMDKLYIHGLDGHVKSDTEFNQQGDLSFEVCVDGKKQINTSTVKDNYQLEVEQMGRCVAGLEQPHISADFSILNAQVMDMVLNAIAYND